MSLLLQYLSPYLNFYYGEHMGRKIWHSTDKYKSIQYRCKNRYEGTKSCDNRNLSEEFIKEEFSPLLWDLMLEKVIVYLDKIEFVWKK